jgi:4-hydroxy-tetrahydrodipicolinate synthase
MSGIYTALVTPFSSDGKIDFEAYRAHVRRQCNAGVDGIIPCGTTGESPTLSSEEKKELIGIALEEAQNSNTVVFAGTGSNCTDESVKFSEWANQAGVKGLLIVAPYYNKPTQQGLIRHFTAIADAVRCEIMVYNIPGRTGISIAPETIAQLAQHPRIRSLKESSGSLSVLSDIQDALKRAGTQLNIYCGDDSLFLPMLSVGACGVVSVASNLVPEKLIKLWKAYEKGDVSRARDTHQLLYPLFRDLFIESNPAPVKYALSQLGWMKPHVRLPLVDLSSSGAKVLQATLNQLGSRKA